MKKIEAFQSNDGVFFTDYAECQRYERLKEIERVNHEVLRAMLEWLKKCEDLGWESSSIMNNE